LAGGNGALAKRRSKFNVPSSTRSLAGLATNLEL
jgi:hypothetical protein